MAKIIEQEKEPIKIGIDPQELKKAVEIMHAIGNKTRVAILSLIREKGETSVHPIYHTLKIEQSITSQQLKILRKVNLVKRRKDGKKAFYSVNEEVLAKIMTFSNNLK